MSARSSSQAIAALPSAHRPATAGTADPAPRTAKAACRERIRFICATRYSAEDFFRSSALGRCLPLYREFPKDQPIELRLFKDNREGLSMVYNRAIEEAVSNLAILVFIHDDVFLNDYYWSDHLHEALKAFDIVGLAGNVRRVPRQASWMYLNDQFVSDSYDNLSGVMGHGEGFPNLRQLSVYGEPGRECKLLDGVMLAARSQLLIEKNLRFDPRFAFDFYDMDFCRQAELRGIRMGTWAISAIHASIGKLGSEAWRAAYQSYLDKYGF
jgi:GT2 family glycosyltransferase